MQKVHRKIGCIIPERHFERIYYSNLKWSHSQVTYQIFRDVKPENILINNNKMKIADFGFAKVVLSSSQLNKTLVGTPLYMSPQLLKS